MKNKIKYSILFLTLTLISFISILILKPRTYKVSQLKVRQEIQYWNLKTGSRIGYIHIPAKGISKPYPIIFLQGGPGGFITDKTIQILGQFAKDGYNIYLYDQIGSGYSDRLEHIKDYTVERHKRDLEEIVNEIKAEKIIIIGQSWGAILATAYTADNQKKVEDLIFTGPGPIVPFRLDLIGIKPPDSLNLKNPNFTNRQANKNASNLRSNTAAFVAKRFGKKLMPDIEADDFQTFLNSELNKSTVVDTSKLLKSEGGGGFYVQIMTIQSFSRTEDPRPKLKNCSIPLLIMKGKYDNQKWGFTSEYLDIFINHKFVIIPNAGHSIAIEKPDIYFNTIRNFLEE